MRIFRQDARTCNLRAKGFSAQEGCGGVSLMVQSNEIWGLTAMSGFCRRVADRLKFRPGFVRQAADTILITTGAAVAVSMLLTIAAPRAFAQETGQAAIAMPDPLTPDAINTLVSRLSDSEVRALLLRELGAQQVADTTPPEDQPTIVETVVTVAGAVADQIVEAVETAPENASASASAIGLYLDRLGQRGTITLGMSILAAFVAGVLVDVLYWRFLLAGSAAGTLAPSLVPPFPASIPHLARRLAREAGGALLALAAAAAVLALALPPREARIGMTIVIWIWFVPRLAFITLKFFLSPRRADLRLVVTDDRTARLLTFNIVGLLLVVGLVATVLRVIEEIGAGPAALKAGFWANLIVFVWLAVIVLLCRSGLQSIVRGRDPEVTPWERWLVRAYPAFAIVAIFLTWLAGAAAPLFGKEDVVRDGRHLVSLALVLLAPMLDTAIRTAVRILVPPMRGTGPGAVAAFEAASRSYVRVARVIVFGSVLVILARLWDVSLFGADGDGGGQFSGLYLEAMLILLCGFVARELTAVFFNRQLANEVAGEASDPAAMDENPALGAAASRLGTVLPPLSWALQGAIVLITVLTALGHIGLNVTALLAGAGVLGIAIGFGAQKLVADVVSGLFFLIEDAFRMNEYINAGGMEGTVEKIALRSMLLRKSDGALQCVPYSNIDAITNFGRDWGTMKQVFTVPFDTNIEKVRKIFKKIGAELSEIPEYKEAFIQPFKYKGVSQVNDVGIVVRGKFMFKPEKSMQFLINREIYKRVQAEFAAAGIQFARREVHVSVDHRGAAANEASAEVAAAAASEAIAASNAQKATTR